MPRLLCLASILALSALAPRAQTAQVLYVPDSIADRVLMLDAETGDVLDATLIQDDRLGTAVQAIPGFGGVGILVADQIEDVVWQFDDDGTFVGVFAPMGGPDPDVLDNVRGIALSADGTRLFVTVASGANGDAVVAFGPDGTFLGPVVAAGAGGLDSPWGVLEREGDLLVSASSTDAVLRFALDGAPLGVFADGLSFPQQVAPTASGGVLVANFSPVATRGYYEYDADGALLGTTTLDALLGAPRGVYELPNGNLLAATSAGLYEVTRAGALVSTKDEGGQYRFVSLATRVTTATEAPPALGFVLEAPHPNPATGLVTVRVRTAVPQDVRVELVDALGRTLRTLHDGAVGGDAVWRVDTSAIAPGLYLVRAYGGDTSAEVRFSVVR